MPVNRAQKRKIVSTPEEEEDLQTEVALNESDEEGGIRVDGIYIPPPPRKHCCLDSNAPRLLITTIHNYFFKSYANTQILGPFYKCFNAIVGPNGSGKSNVIDAMLFVFGYRASKIRSKKISVLIHNSEHYPNISSCTVAVNFALIIDKDDGYEIIPGSEFEISRTANKDNSSYYQLNGHRVQFKEVACKLRSHGIDLDHNRFLILQGEVEQIAMMKCKGTTEHETGMLEYLEDIIGTSRFKVPLVKLEERVELLADQRCEKLNRVKLVQKELDELKQPMEAAVEFLELENTIILSKNIIFQWHINQAEENIKKIEEERSEVVTVQEELVSKLANVQSEKSAAEQNLKEASKKCEIIQKKSDKIKEAFDVANNKDIQFQAEMVQINKTRKKTKEILAEERKKLIGFQKVPDENKKTIEECITKVEQLTTKKEELDAEKEDLLATLQTTTVQLQEEKEHLQIQLGDLRKGVDSAKASVVLAESALEIYIKDDETEKAKLEELKNICSEIQNTLTDRGGEIKMLEQEIPKKKALFENGVSDFNAAREEEASITHELRKKRASLAEIQSSMQATRSRGRVLDSLMQQKNEGACPGLFGRLGDLGAIKQKYDVAISTACGPLDNVVVDTVSTAQWCIEFLKHHDIGRATFIALEKQEHLRRYANAKIQTPENVPRLFDLIEIKDERIKPAFYYALRDTLVADDLEQASRIAYGAQRYRVVTLTGQLIETTGTMSGGGKTVSRGRMGQSVVSTTDPKHLNKLEKDLQNKDERLREIRQKLIHFENERKAMDNEIQQMQIKLQKYTIEFESAKNRQPDLNKRLKAQEIKTKSVKANPATVEQHKKNINEKKKIYNKALESTQELQTQVDQLTKEINAKTVGKMKAMDQKLKTVTDGINKCKSEITRCNVGVKTAERNAKKSADKISSMEQDIEKAENALRSMKVQRETIETDGRELLQSIEGLTVELTEAEESCLEFKKSVTAFAKSENQIKSEKIEIDQKCKVFDKKINERKGEIHSFRAKLTQLKLQEIPDQSMEELKTFMPEELKQKDVQNLQRQLNYNEEQLKVVKPNLNAITEYKKKQLVFIDRSKELDELSQQKDKVKETLDNVRQRRREEFITGYNIIRMKLKEMYEMITLGGNADFEMVDTFDPFTEGIQFNVRPPKKSWKSISNLSGGEKTLSSLALVFALHYYKPSPLYVMDEIDAALDFKNVSIVANYIKERTKNAQFIIISLRSNMFELCDHIIGICKIFSCTKTITLDLTECNKDDQNIVPQEEEVPVNQNVSNTNPNAVQVDEESINESNSSQSVINSSLISEQMEVDS